MSTTPSEVNAVAEESNELENQGRRTAVKTIVGGFTALAAYHVLPSKWGTPIIEQIFLPAHAQTSGIMSGSYRAPYQVAGAEGGPATNHILCITISGSSATFVEYEIGHESDAILGGPNPVSGPITGVGGAAVGFTTLVVNILSSTATEIVFSLHGFNSIILEDYGTFQYTASLIPGSCS